jgi:membrane protease YdiL (CAAX protease family)
MTQTPERLMPGTVGAEALGPRRALNLLDVILAFAVTAGIVLVSVFAILMAASQHVAPFDQDPLSAAVAALLLIEPAAIFAAVYFVLILGRGFDWSDLGLRPVNLGWAGIAVLAALACLAVSGAVTQITERFGEKPMIDEYMQVLAPSGLTMRRTALIVITVGFLIPVVEELLFRGVLYNWLRQYLTVVPCIVISAVLFSGAHVTPRMAIQYFIAGAVLAFLYERSRSLLASIVAHMTVNSISLGIILYYAGSGVPT